MEQKALNEALALYQASVRRSPALMMETVNVDSNRGVTARGNSPYDKFASPETRAKVLESRMQEIAAFAQSRSIPASNLYALAEAAMRTGKIPDMGQFGLAGDDAVATKQFLISNVLNIAGLEWVDYKGDPVEEAEEKKEKPQSIWDRARKESETNSPDEARRIAARWGPAAPHSQAAAWRQGKPCPYTGCPSPYKQHSDVDYEGDPVEEAWGKETDVDCLVTRPDGHRVAIEIKDRYKYTVRFFEDEGVVLSKSKVARALLFATHRDAEPLFVVRTKEGRVFAARMADITATSPTEWFQRQRGSDHRVDHEEPVYRIDWSLFEEMPIRE